MTESNNQTVKKSKNKPYKLVGGVSYSVISELTGIGWAAKFSHEPNLVPLISWAMVKKPTHIKQQEDCLNATKKVGLVCLDGVTVVPCDLVDTFECYVRHIPTIETYVS
ncbi:MAG: hypothetical protein HRU18_27770 [Pseudoalteromonas sp.]|uniref:hypothetical protein n=1 Tax=Pseudoalteromonas sp. TaxID=53249 RepID=UPI001A37485F|nr:hypothetical protein [Pseudoalteromonas sp.]MBL4638509.1 hypothetical protein [Pseudomonadota bacterium]NRA82012.1 hypothetical protein [Pseudoalteromonas sp.]